MLSLSDTHTTEVNNTDIVPVNSVTSRMTAMHIGKENVPVNAINPQSTTRNMNVIYPAVPKENIYKVAPQLCPEKNECLGFQNKNLE